MASFAGCFLLFSILLLFLHHITSSAQQQTCETTSCGSDRSRGPSIQSPFYLKGVQSEDCGYPDFGVVCNHHNQTLIRLGNAGDFVLKEISFNDQEVLMTDPNDCLLSRFLHGDLDLLLHGSPFRWSSDYRTFVNVDFMNCTGPLPHDLLRRSRKIPCLSGNTTDSHNFSVVAVLSDPAFPTSFLLPPPGCQLISSSLVPVNSSEHDRLWNDHNSDFRLTWNDPNCIYPPDPDVEDNACYNNSLNPENRESAPFKIYKILAVGVAGTIVFCVAGLARLLGARVERPDGLPRRRMMNGELVTINTAESVDVGMGLDESTIEQYPKTQVGQSGRLPNPGDNVCSICLSEYEPTDTLRTIPHCNHYFHAHCIDGWLKKKGTCPLCRHLPHAPSLSLSSSASHRSLIPT